MHVAFAEIEGGTLLFLYISRMIVLFYHEAFSKVLIVYWIGLESCARQVGRLARLLLIRGRTLDYV